MSTQRNFLKKLLTIDFYKSFYFAIIIIGENMKSLSQRKAEKSKEKELLEKLKKEEEELEKEIDNLMEEDKYTIKEALSLLNEKDEEDLEYESYLTEEEKLENLEKEKEEKKIAKLAASLVLVISVLMIVGVKIFYDNFKSDLLKTTEPLLKEHYYKTYGIKAKTKSIEEFKTKGENNSIIGTGIYLLTTKDNKHIMSKNNELIGDDVNTSKRNEYISNYISRFLGNAELITHYIDLSYKDYYLEYNRFLDYINVLPFYLSDNELLSSNKLTVTYKAIYKGDLDPYLLQNAMNTFSNDSTFVLLRQESSGINEVTIIKKDKVITLDITAEIEKDTGISYLELNRELNGITNVNIKRYVDTAVKNEDGYKIINPMEIELEKENKNRNELEKTEYYLLRINEGIIDESSFVELSTYKKDNEYIEQEKEKYSDVFLISVGSYTYILGENSMLIGKKEEKKSFLCDLGIC